MWQENVLREVTETEYFHWFFLLCRERETHSVHLKNIEAELDAQMAKVEQQALAKAKQEYDNERRVLQQKMDAELTELQTQLKLFQKVPKNRSIIFTSYINFFESSIKRITYEKNTRQIR